MTPFSKWKTIGYAAAIFVTGAISGGALGIYETKSGLFAPPPEQEMALRIRNRLQEKLGLSNEQMTKVTPIIESTARDLHAVRMEAAQRVNRVFEDAYARLSSVLTPEQRAKLDQMQRERRAMMQRHFWQDHHWHGDGPAGREGAPRESFPRSSPSEP